MRLKLIVMMMLVGFLPFTINTAMGIEYTININDINNILSASVSPEGTGSVYAYQANDHDSGSLSWFFMHSIDLTEPAYYYYNIYKDVEQQSLSNQLNVILDSRSEGAVYVLFIRDSLSGGDLIPWSEPTASLPQVYTLTYALSGGDNLVVHYDAVPAPEPGTLVLLLGAAAVGLLAYRWRRRK